jgi:hypothetical protein
MWLSGIGSKAIKDFLMDSSDLKLQFEQTMQTLGKLNPVVILILKIVEGLKVRK